MARKVKTKKRLTIADILLKVSVFGLTVYLVIAIVAGQIDILSKRQELAQLDNKITQQQASNMDLERILANGDSQEYMERIAREKLGYVDPDEKIYMDISGK